MGARWEIKDWVDICTQVYLDNPGINLDSKEYREIKQNHILNAMRKVMPEDKWRNSIWMGSVHDKIVAAMTILKESIRGAKEQNSLETEGRIHQFEEIKRTRKHVDAMMPLLDGLAEGLFLRMQPMLETYLKARLADVPEREATERAIQPVLPTIKRLRIGIIGLLPIQYQEVLKAFPELDIEYAEGNARKKDIQSKMGNCMKVFALTSKMNHGAEHWLDREKLVLVSGGTTTMKRNIEIWLATIS